MTMKHKYVLITAARNEEKYVHLPIKSVLSQTLLPARWIIVSDRSTDRTCDIVSQLIKNHSYIELVSIENDSVIERSFGAKVHAINSAFESLKHLDFDFVGILDADVSFGPDYFSDLLDFMFLQPQLGISGGTIVEDHGSGYRQRFGDYDYLVAGAVQMFSRKCYEAIGGFIPLRYGGEDALMIEYANFKGYQTRCNRNLLVRHHRLAGTESGSLFKDWKRQGLLCHSLGMHPVYMFFRFINRMRLPPRLFGSLYMLLHYTLAYIRQPGTSLPSDLLRHIRKSQMNRIFSIFRPQKPS